MVARVEVSKKCPFCIGGTMLFTDGEWDCIDGERIKAKGEWKCINCGRGPDWKPQISLPFDLPPQSNNYPRHSFGCAIWEGDCLTCPLPDCKWQQGLGGWNRGTLKKWRDWIEKNGNGHKKISPLQMKEKNEQNKN